MTVQRIKNELFEIGKVYPTLLGLLQRAVGKGNTVGNVWATQLSELNFDHVSNVCFEYANLQRRLPDTSDRLIFEIADEVKKRQEKDAQQLSQHSERLRYRIVKSGCSDARDWSPEQLAKHWKESFQSQPAN